MQSPVNVNSSRVGVGAVKKRVHLLLKKENILQHLGCKLKGYSKDLSFVNQFGAPIMQPIPSVNSIRMS